MPPYILIAIKKNEKTFEEKIANYHKIQTIRDSIFKNSIYHASFVFHTSGGGYVVKNKVFTKKDYDSCEASISPARRDNFFERKLNLSLIRMNDQYLRNAEVNNESFANIYFATLPKSFFFLLPFFAFVLWVFFNHKPYTEHIIFSLHYHTVGFLAFSIPMLLSRLFPNMSIQFIVLTMFIYNVVYLLFAMKHVYQESWPVTILKFIVFDIVYFFSLIMLSVGLIILSYLMV